MLDLPAELLPQTDEDKFLNQKGNARWESLKPVIVKLYTGNFGKNGKPATIDEIADAMKRHYSFHAAYVPNFKHPFYTSSTLANTNGIRDSVSQYPHWFRRWGVSDRRMTKELVEEIAMALSRHSKFRSSLFLQGRLEELMISMGQHDRKLFVDYLHQLYMHGFCSAKNWNPSFTIPPAFSTPAFTPQMWNATSPWTPSVFIDLPSSPFVTDFPGNIDVTMPPTQLCRWSMHVPHINYEPIPAEYDSMPNTLSFTESLQEVLTSASSGIDGSGDLPVSREIISQALEDNPTTLQSESLRLAIMAGNFDLLDSLLDKVLEESDYYDNNEVPQHVVSIHPYHLAASYLNGGGPCCMIFNTLNCMMPSYLFRNSLDDHGHTILDSILVSILRSHSSVRPDVVNHDFGVLSRFPGEEKDTCGRWDADSPEVRELFSKGYARIPTSWKHPFCHSAVQTVCHALMIIFGSRLSPNINSLSGLFLRRCTECGIELRLGPVHTLIVTAFFLGQSGMAGETLFGPMAILVGLISFGADVTLRAHVSIEEIIGIPIDMGQCHHTSLSAAELIQTVPARVIQNWSDDCQVGWSCLHQVILQAEDVERDFDINTNTNTRWEEMSETGSSCGSQGSGCGPQCELAHEDLSKIQCTGPTIGLTWAAIQAELLTYRRVGETDPWISNNFPMRALDAWLKREVSMFESPLVCDQILKAHSLCGWFLSEKSAVRRYGNWDMVWPMAENVCRKRFDTMDDYKRSSFVFEIGL
ncbi:Ff.00g134380.m01.CDS01 [Fusarium sp. VM40]|nr:Ff.00g134380.m01.CDS01 [Fusarium sp. VM40]